MHIWEPVEQPVKNHCGKDIQTQVHTKLFHGRKHLYLEKAKSWMDKFKISHKNVGSVREPFETADHIRQ